MYSDDFYMDSFARSAYACCDALNNVSYEVPDGLSYTPVEKAIKTVLNRLENYDRRLRRGMLNLIFKK